tara:strand:- start:1403 stop:1822 length:420 start_codon:yes stop_codon:yes gene_type:complete
MRCLKCSSNSFNTLDTRNEFHPTLKRIHDVMKDHTNAIYRRKQCAECGFMFFTKEHFIIAYEKLQRVVKVVQKPEKKKTKISKPKPTPKPNKPKVTKRVSAKKVKHDSKDSLFDEVEDLENRVNLDDIGKELGIDFGKE